MITDIVENETVRIVLQFGLRDAMIQRPNNPDWKILKRHHKFRNATWLCRPENVPEDAFPTGFGLVFAACLRGMRFSLVVRSDDLDCRNMNFVLTHWMHRKTTPQTGWAWPNALDFSEPVKAWLCSRVLDGHKS